MGFSKKKIPFFFSIGPLKIEIQNLPYLCSSIPNHRLFFVTAKVFFNPLKGTALEWQNSILFFPTGHF